MNTGTERFRGEEALLDFTWAIVEAVREPLVVLDDKLRVIFANRSFYRTFGAAPEETEGRLLYDLVNQEWDIPKLRELLEDILPKNTSFDDFEVEHDFETIGRRSILLNARRIYRDGEKTEFILLAMEDITPRKRTLEDLAESEAKFRDLAERSVVGVYLIQDGVFKYVNPKLAEIFGYTREELIDRMGPQDLVFPEDWPTVRENLRQRLDGEIDSIHYDFRGRTRDDGIVDVEVYGTRTVYKGAPAVIGSLLDITRRRELEKANLEAKDWVIEEMRHHEEYVFEVADRLRNPLQIIKGFLEMFGEEDLTPRQKDILERILGSTRKLEEGIKKLT
jgi:PAS domain S-box-containing protein